MTFRPDESARCDALYEKLVRRDATSGATAHNPEWLQLVDALRSLNGALQGELADRRQSETEARDNEARLRGLLHAVPVGIGVVVGHAFTFVNRPLCEITGYSEGELVGQRARLLFAHDRDYEALGGEDNTQLWASGPASLQARWRRQDGRVLKVLLRPARLDVNDLSKGVAITVSDITERKQAEQIARESGERLRLAMQTIQMGTWEWDVRENRVSWSPETLSIFGTTAMEFGGTYEAYAEFVAPECREQVNDKVRAFLRDARENAMIQYEHEIVRGDGQRAWIEVRGTLLIDQQDAPTRFVGICTDITERKQTEARREELEAQLRQSQKLEAVGQLAGGVAHDFNNLLTAILGNVELSIDTVQGALGPEHSAVESIQQIERAAQRASTLTRQLLTFSRRSITQPRVLILNEILADMDRMLRRLINESIALETVPGADLHAVFADAGQLEQVIVNLVVNAGHAMPNGGRLTLETQNVTLDEDYVHQHAVARPGPHVMLAVSDTGHGIDAATRERIFEPFFTTKPVDQGTGLGLATVHGIVTQSGGHVMVYSEVGRGTTFKVYLPATDAHPDVQEPAHTDETPVRGDETILLCEDDGPVRDLIAQTLRAAGYEVFTAANGKEALEAADQYDGRIGLLVTDVIMPESNGRALSEQLRLKRTDLATLFISGYTSNVIAHHGVLDEGVEFLEKPFTRQTLLGKVREVLRKAASDS
jgi:two-component system cell cycle sensor histidine kinase/response regulator CckA